jgi:beta-phosphoglucomutase-like phosphatase (HAD superfamily)
MVQNRRGLFLDLDGTLANSLHVLKQVFVQFKEKYGLNQPEQFEEFNGPPLEVIVQILKDRWRINDSAENLLQEYLNAILARYGTVDLFDDARTLLESFPREDWFVAVVTSNTAAISGRWLKTHGIDSVIDLIVSGDSVLQGKPHPEPYLKALRESGCSPENTMAVEDSRSGVMSALSAGIPTYFVQRSTVNPEFQSQAIKIRSLTEIFQEIIK